MEENSTKNLIVIGCSFVFGTILLALCYNLFLGPHNFVIAGFTGVGIALEELFGFSATLFIYITNFILLIISFIFLGYDKTKNTIIGSILYPVMITLTMPLSLFINQNFPIQDNFLIILFASIMYGVGNGLVYKSGFTTGGNDVLMQLLNKYFKIPESKALSLVNGIVIILGAFTFGYMKGIYSFIIMLIASLFIDKVMFGIADSKVFYIFTRKASKVKKIIINDFKSGYTIYPTKGGYSHHNGSVLMCVVPNKDYYLLKSKILEVDPKAFFVIENCYEVNGGVVRKNLSFLDKF